MVERDDLSGIVEGSDSLDGSASHIDETIGVKRLVFRSDVERAGGVDHLHVRIEGAVVIGELETALERQRLSTPDVGEPDQCAADARSGALYPPFEDLSAADVLVERGTDDRIRRNGPIGIDGSGDAATGNRNHRVRPGRRCDDGRTGRDAIAGGLVASPGRNGIVARAGGSDGEKHYVRQRPAEH